MILHLSHIFFTEGLTFMMTRSLQFPEEAYPAPRVLGSWVKDGASLISSIYTPQPQAFSCFSCLAVTCFDSLTLAQRTTGAHGTRIRHLKR
jgi:hypothetical protein